FSIQNQNAAHGIHNVVISRPRPRQSSDIDTLIPLGCQVRLDAPLLQGLQSFAANGSNLHTRKNASIQTKTLETVPHRLHGVRRSERNPAMRTTNQLLRGAIHLRPSAGRLDRRTGNEVPGSAEMSVK